MTAPARPRCSVRLALLVACVLVAGSAPVPAAGPAIVESKFELFTSDVASSVAFWEALGFDVAQRKEGGYTTLVSGATVVALSPVPRWLPLRWLGFLRRPPLGTEIVLYTRELEAARRTLVEAGHDPGEIARQPWGDRDFRVHDPEGYYVRVSEGRALPEKERPLVP